MEEFRDPLPETGFYEVRGVIVATDVVLAPGEIAGLVRRGKSHYFLIVRTGREWGGKGNYANPRHMASLRKLTPEEVFKLTDGQPIPKKAFITLRAFAEACKLFNERKRLA